MKFIDFNEIDRLGGRYKNPDIDGALYVLELNGLLKESHGHELLEAAARDFVGKVERGEAKSKRSYAAFKGALAELQ